MMRHFNTELCELQLQCIGPAVDEKPYKEKRSNYEICHITSNVDLRRMQWDWVHATRDLFELNASVEGVEIAI